jgi:hypothetical protein
MMRRIVSLAVASAHLFFRRGRHALGSIEGRGPLPVSRADGIGIAVALATSLLLLVASAATAGTTGQLTGFVFDEQGLPLADVAVAASSPAQIGGDQLATTGADGSFVFPRLAPGYYSLRLELVGYAPQQLAEVQVRLDRVTTVRVDLSPKAFAGQIEVAEVTPVVDVVQVSTGQTFSSDYISETSADWGNLITQTAGTDPKNFRRMLGSTPQDNAYKLDGFDATNWYQRFPDPAALYLPFDAVQEVAVHTAGFEAEYGQASGGVISVMTKSGGNLFSGTVDIRYTGSNLQSSGEHYDPDEQESEDARFSVTLGGPIVTDRIWFFTSYARNNSKTTPTGAPTTEVELTQNFLGKLSWRPGAAWSFVGKYSYTPWVTDNYLSSQFRAPEATSEWIDDSTFTSLDVVGLITDATLWEFRLGRKSWDETGLPSDGDLETIGHFNLATGETYGNYVSQFYGETDQIEVATDLIWFLGGSVGSHELKGGVSYGEPTITDDGCLNGTGRCREGTEGLFFRDIVGDDGSYVPYIMQVEANEGVWSYGGQYIAAYLQDAWRLRPGLTLKLGVRWDNTSYDNNAGEQIADLNRLQPRAGVAWDVGGSGRSVLRASWGRFMHPGTLIMATLTAREEYPLEFWLSCSLFISPDPEECAAISESFGLGYRTDPEGWDPAGWWLDPGNVIQTAPNQADPGLRAGFTDQWIVGFEQEVFRRTSLELSYIRKSGRSFSDDTCNGNFPEPDPDGACDFWIITNVPDMRSDYEGWMLRLESSGLDWLHLLASWVVSSSKGSVDSNTSATGSYDYFPFHYVNRYGYLSDHSRQRAKVNGYIRLPSDFTISVSGWWDSDFRWTPVDRLVPGMPYGEQFVEPRGSRQGNSLYQLDLQLSKGFRLGPTRFVLLGTVINATDSQQGNEICNSVSGCGDFGFGEPTGWQQPRRYEVGFRVEF